MNRRRRSRPGRPDQWAAILERSYAHWRLLDAGEQARMGDLMEEMLTAKRWEAAHGFALTDEVCTLIAAQASLLILELGIECYEHIGSIIVHPTTITRHTRGSPGPVPGTVVDGVIPLLGQTQYRGPILIAWDSARASGRNPGRGDVVLHELAHVLDLLDGFADGTPPLPDAATRDRWIEVWTAELAALRAGAGSRLLSTYAAKSPGEMFAVTTEVFFGRPVALQADRPELYRLLRAFYRQDPAARVRRGITPARLGSPSGARGGPVRGAGPAGGPHRRGGGGW